MGAGPLLEGSRPESRRSNCARVGPEAGPGGADQAPRELRHGVLRGEPTRIHLGGEHLHQVVGLLVRRGEGVSDAIGGLPDLRRKAAEAPLPGRAPAQDGLPPRQSSADGLRIKEMYSL